MWENGCLSRANISDAWVLNQNNQNNQQRFGQYGKQFIDRNSDNDSDNGDEDGDGSIIGDDDDLFLWIWPTAFSWSVDPNKVWELYLINAAGNERTYFRWRVETALWWFVPTGAVCDYSNPENPTGEACQGTIETLKLIGRDYWFDHVPWTIDTDGSQWDGVIDTWFIHPDFISGWGDEVAGFSSDNYWQPIFPDSINISDFEIYAYPNKDLEYSWRDGDESILVSPYIRLKYTIRPSLDVQAKIVWKAPSVEIATTIQLSSLDLR